MDINVTNAAVCWNSNPKIELIAILSLVARNVLNRRQKTKMNTLPTEIIDLILETIFRDIRTAMYWPGYSGDPFSDLKSLRLCNKIISSASSVYVFKEIVLYFTEGSHARMKAIANKPMLSKHVRTIRIVPCDAPGPWLTTSAFEKRLADERTLLGRDPRHLDITRDRDCMSEYVSHQGLYSLPHNARSEFLTTAEKILTNAVVSFFGLKRIVSGMGWPLFRYQGWRTERDD